MAVRLVVKPSIVPPIASVPKVIIPTYSIVSWNINGYRDIIHEWLTNYIFHHQPDIVFLSETKKSAEFLRTKFAAFMDYEVIINCHTP